MTDFMWCLEAAVQAGVYVYCMYVSSGWHVTD